MTRERLQRALETARAHLLSLRLPEGYWEGRLSSSALSTATAVSTLVLANQQQDRNRVAAGVRWLCDNQNADGSWGDTPDSPGNLATTLLVCSALHLAERSASPSCAGGGAVVTAGPSVRGRCSRPRGDEESEVARRLKPAATMICHPTNCRSSGGEEALARAEEYLLQRAGPTPQDRVAAIRAAYGEDRTFAVPILMNCALAGLVPWEAMPGLPFELAALPRGLYRAVRLQVVSYALPALIAVGLHIHQHNPPCNPLLRLVRRLVRGPVLRKLAAIQPQSGGFLEAAPLTSFVAMSLLAMYGAEQQTAARCLEFLRAGQREDGSWPIDTNLSVWVTSNALRALSAGTRLLASESTGESDRPRPHEELSATLAWLAARQHHRVHPYTGARPGGWGWSHLSGAVPDADDTSGAILALVGEECDANLDAGVKWLLDLQNADGGWPTFCRGWGRLPFDQSCPDITAHALRALAAYLGAGGTGSGPVVGKRSADRRAARCAEAVRRGLEYLCRTQQEDGSWLPLWFGNQAHEGQTNPVLGTSRVLMALAVLGPDTPEARKGLDFLRSCPNPDGGWGGAAGVPSTIEETALATVALCHWPGAANPETARGVEYLVARIEDGSWTTPAPIGLYFARLWYSERLYPVAWTVEALGAALAVWDALQ